MSPIPPKIKRVLEKNPKMKKCLVSNIECSGRVEWHHCFCYQNRQIQEIWAIQPLCHYHHNNPSSREFACFTALIAGLNEAIKKYPRHNWQQDFNYLLNKYEKI